MITPAICSWAISLYYQVRSRQIEQEIIWKYETWYKIICYWKTALKYYDKASNIWCTARYDSPTYETALWRASIARHLRLWKKIDIKRHNLIMAMQMKSQCLWKCSQNPRSVGNMALPLYPPQPWSEVPQVNFRRTQATQCWRIMSK